MSAQRKRFRPKPLSLKRKILLAVIVAVPVLGIIMFGNRGVLKRVELEMQHDDVYQQLYAERQTADSLKTAIERVKIDTAEIERLARERFGMVRPGERIYKVVEE